MAAEHPPTHNPKPDNLRPEENRPPMPQPIPFKPQKDDSDDMAKWFDYTNRNVFRAITEGYQSPDYSQKFHTIAMRMSNSEAGSQLAYDWYVASISPLALGLKGIPGQLTLKHVMEHIVTQRGRMHWVDLGAGLGYAQEQLVRDPSYADILRTSKLTSIDLEDMRSPRGKRNPITFIRGDMATVTLPEKADLITQTHNFYDLNDPLQNFSRWFNQLEVGGFVLVLGMNNGVDPIPLKVEGLNQDDMLQEFRRIGAVIGERQTRLLDLEECPYPDVLKYYSLAMRRNSSAKMHVNAQLLDKQTYRKSEKPLFELAE